MTDINELAKHGFSEGWYWHRECKGCQKDFTAEKRSWNCYGCALASLRNAEAQEKEKEKPMTKKPTSAEIEAAQRFLAEKIELCEMIIATHKNAVTAPIFNKEVLGLPFYQTMQNALAWCAEQEQKGES